MPDDSLRSHLVEPVAVRRPLRLVVQRYGLALVICTLAPTGCSCRVRQEQTAAPPKSTSSEAQAARVEKSATEMEVAVLQERRAEAAGRPEPPSAPATKPEPAPQVVVINVVRDESQHVVHIHAPPERRRETVWMRIEVEKETPADDPECLRAMEAHKERVRRWAEEFRRR